MTRVAFIGLGVMGSPMAANLLHAGFDVIGYNRSRPAIERLVAAGGRAAGSVAEAVRDADTVATMLPDTPDVIEVLGGAIPHARPDTLVIDFSTIRPDAAAALAATAAGAGLRMLDAPVSGGETGAQSATLSIMVGGHPADVVRARPVLDAVGSTIVHVGPAGAGQTVKAANQLIVGGTIALVAEALVLLEASGVETGQAVTALSGGLARSAVLERKAAMMRERSFPPGFRVRLHDKDMRIVADAARDVDVVLPVSELIAALTASATAQGWGDLDHSVLVRLIAQLSGRT